METKQEKVTMLSQALVINAPKGCNLTSLVCSNFANHICLATLKGKDEDAYYQLTVIPNVCKDNQPINILKHLISYLYVEKHILARVDARNAGTEFDSKGLRVAYNAIKASNTLTNIYKFNSEGKICKCLESDLVLKDTPLNIDKGTLQHLCGNSQEKRVKIHKLALHTLDLFRATSLIGYVHLRLLETLQRLNIEANKCKKDKKDKKDKKTA